MQFAREDGSDCCRAVYHSSHRTDVHQWGVFPLTDAVTVQTECEAEGKMRVLRSAGTLDIPI